MNKEQVLAIPSLTERQKETVEKLFNSPYYRKKGEIEGDDEEQVKEFLDKAYVSSQRYAEAKAKRNEKYGTFAQVEALVKGLVKDNVYTYKGIVNIINKATEERRQAIENYKAKVAEVEAMKEALGI